MRHRGWARSTKNGSRKKLKNTNPSVEVPGGGQMVWLCFFIKQKCNAPKNLSRGLLPARGGWSFGCEQLDHHPPPTFGARWFCAVCFPYNQPQTWQHGGGCSYCQRLDTPFPATPPHPTTRASPPPHFQLHLPHPPPACCCSRTFGEMVEKMATPHLVDFPCRENF